MSKYSKMPKKPLCSSTGFVSGTLRDHNACKYIYWILRFWKMLENSKTVLIFKEKIIANPRGC